MKWFNKKSKFNVQGLRRKGTKNKVIAVFAAICLFVFIVALSGKVLLSSLTSSVYNITDLNNLDNVNVGDTINYSINGYSDWKVLSVDKNNGTVDVTSATNTKDLTIDPYKSVDEYNQLFQTEADRFLDNNYVVSARTINKADALTFNDESDEEYWLANVNENTLMTNKIGEDGSSAIWTKNTFETSEIYVVPQIGIKQTYNDPYPQVGEVLNYSIAGIDSWIFTGSTLDNGGGENSENGVRVMSYVPATPILLHVDSVDQIPDVVNGFYNSLLQQVQVRPEIHICSGGFALSNNDLILLYEGKNYFDNKDMEMYIFSSNMYYYQRNYRSRNGGTWNVSATESSNSFETKEGMYSNSTRYKSGNAMYIDVAELNRTTVSNTNRTSLSKDVTTFYTPKTLTFGYRPVLTLRVGSASGNATDYNNSQLNVGDYVLYDANDYKNWRVLSINRTDGTVDIISGGLVKNLSLYGKNDYDNYEEILQREVDLYKEGSNAISARAIQESDIELLYNINDDVGGLYWYNKKTQRRLDDHWDLQISNINSELSYNVGILYNDGNTINPYMARLYSQVGNLTDKEKVEQYLGAGDLGYIAGLRPVITLKADAVKILPNEDIDDIKNQTNRYNQSYISAQKSANRGSKISVIGNSGGIGSDYYDSDDLFNNNVGTNLQNVVLDIGKSNSVLKIIFIIAFIYRFILVAACTYVGYYLIKRRYI